MVNLSQSLNCMYCELNCIFWREEAKYVGLENVVRFWEIVDHSERGGWGMEGVEHYSPLWFHILFHTLANNDPY